MTHDTNADTSWKSVTTPFAVDLTAITDAGEIPFAVGGSGTVVAERDSGWETVLDDGPAGKNRTLQAVDATDDGARVWFAGASGAIGMYDRDRARVYDYSYAKDVSASWTAVAAAGDAGAESLLVANGSGTVLPIDVGGLEPTYGTPVTPGPGSAITALAHSADGVGYAVDTDGNVFEAAVEGWTTAGVEATSASVADVAVGPASRVYVATESGTLYRRSSSETGWTAVEVPAARLDAVDVDDGHVAVLGDGDTVYRRPVEGRDRWRSEELPTSNQLVDLALGRPDVAVGTSGTVVERPAAEAGGAGSKQEAPPEPAAETVGVCDLLRAELVARLGREELRLALERHADCESALVEALGEAAEESTATDLLARAEQAPTLVLPVATGAPDRRRHGHGAGGGPCLCRCEDRTRASIERLHRER